MPSRPHAILIADDDEAIRTMSMFLFREHGFAVWSAADGREAVELYRYRQDAIDVVLLDVQMPGQDGPDILSAIREIDPSVCCCFASGDLGKWTEAELLRRGAVRVFPKPFPRTSRRQSWRWRDRDVSAPEPVSCEMLEESGQWDTQYASDPRRFRSDRLRSPRSMLPMNVRVQTTAPGQIRRPRAGTPAFTDTDAQVTEEMSVIEVHGV